MTETQDQIPGTGRSSVERSESSLTSVLLFTSTQQLTPDNIQHRMTVQLVN